MSDKDKKKKKDKEKTEKSHKAEKEKSVKMPKNDSGQTEKILVLFGSPRKNGHTRDLTDALIEARGLEAEYIFVNSLKIKGCQGCRYCQSHEGECKPKDDMTGLYDKIRRAGKVIMAFPVYYGGIPGEYKCMIDRLYAVSSIKKSGDKNVYGSIWQEKRDLFLIVSHGNSIPEVKDSIERSIKYFCVDTNSSFKGSYFSEPTDYEVKEERAYLKDLLTAAKDF